MSSRGDTPSSATGGVGLALTEVAMKTFLTASSAATRENLDTRGRRDAG